MPKTFRDIILARLRADPTFRATLLQEAAQNLRSGEVEIALEQILDVLSVEGWVEADPLFDRMQRTLTLAETKVAELLAHFDPAKHRRDLQLDDGPVGTETD